MPDEFDPYRQWLGRTAVERPLNHYQLLGLQDFEADISRIENAEMIEMAKVLRHESGPHAAIAHRVAEELHQAVATLSDPQQKASYDAGLRTKATASATQANFYQLLNLPDFEDNRQRIENAEMIEIAKALRQGNSQACEALELAVRTLLDPELKAAYDANLRNMPGSTSTREGRATGERPIEHEFSADLKLDEEEEESFEADPPAAPQAVPMNEESTASPTSLWQEAATQADDSASEGSSPALASKREVENDAVSAAIDQQIRRAAASIERPEKRPASASRSMPKVSMPTLSAPKIPLKPLAGVAALIGLATVAYLFLTRGEPTGQPHGSVTLQGSPAAGAQMRFESTANPDYLFIGAASRDGIYHLSYRTFDGLPIGHYRITITHSTPQGGKPQVRSEEEGSSDDENAVQKSVVFERDIAKGSNAMDFELTQGQEVKPAG